MFALFVLRIFHYSPWYTYSVFAGRRCGVENLSLFALIYLVHVYVAPIGCWESFIIRLDILIPPRRAHLAPLRIFHYSPWYTYGGHPGASRLVENLSLFALIYLPPPTGPSPQSWESFIIRLDILTQRLLEYWAQLRIFHYSPWYTYEMKQLNAKVVENLSLFALIYLADPVPRRSQCWESFIIRLDILNIEDFQSALKLRIFHYSPWYTYERPSSPCEDRLRIFHYSPWYTYRWARLPIQLVENLSLFALIYLFTGSSRPKRCWESFIIRLDILTRRYFQAT